MIITHLVIYANDLVDIVVSYFQYGRNIVPFLTSAVKREKVGMKITWQD